ncbi:MAG: methyl-accepting chemotaxis protein [Desulfobulbaceae bacterium]|nr:methyl-accepting chemotaxis protein [Desulfobulbaceae bacterium]HIJ79794.1 HAMP domain-containing protein [Deltaproteobacteria bacterium]
MKIGQKLALGFGIVIVLMIILGATGIIQLNNVNTGYKVDVKKEEFAKFLAQKLQADVLQVRRNEKDFMARQDLKYFQKGNNNLELAEKDVSILMETTANQEIRNELNLALQGLAAYRYAFARLAKASEERGLNENLGVQGNFRASAHQLSADMDKYDVDDIRYWLLMMRRYEKDLHLNLQNASVGEKYLMKFNSALQSCRTVVTESKLEPGLQAQVKDDLEQYGLALGEWYKGKVKYQQVRAAAGKMEEFINRHYIPNGKVLLLTLRKEEKDYMLRSNEKYIARLEKTAAVLSENIETSLLDQSAKNELKARLDNYTAGIKILVAKDIEIAGLLNEMKASADPVLELSDEVVEQTSQLADQISREISSSAALAITVVWVIGIMSVIIATVFAYFFGRSISIPLQKAAAMLTEMGKGHLDQRLRMERADEIGEMAKTMDEFADSLQGEMVAALNKLAHGDLTFDAVPYDENDIIRNSLKKAGVDLNKLISEIFTATEQIASASGQVSDSSQALSQGATEQAASLEEITSSMTEMGSQTKHNAENATLANQLAGQTRSAAESGNAKMQEMVTAMEEINEAGQNISRIIKVIDEIAFQTNLLALNAAVEAARAGRHGKGFAVVAEEVRNLAARSARAAKETDELIKGSVAKTQNGAEIARQTSEALAEIVNSISKVNGLVGEIAAASAEQAQGINQAGQALGQIDQVTQQNTASAEQSAAAAEELSSQALHMKDMMSNFTIKDGGTRQQPAIADNQGGANASKGGAWG